MVHIRRYLILLKNKKNIIQSLNFHLAHHQKYDAIQSDLSLNTYHFWEYEDFTHAFIIF